MILPRSEDLVMARITKWRILIVDNVSSASDGNRSRAGSCLVGTLLSRCSHNLVVNRWNMSIARFRTMSRHASRKRHQLLWLYNSQHMSSLSMQCLSTKREWDQQQQSAWHHPVMENDGTGQKIDFLGYIKFRRMYYIYWQRFWEMKKGHVTMCDGHLGQISGTTHNTRLSKKSVSIHLNPYSAGNCQRKLDQDKVDKILENSFVMTTATDWTWPIAVAPESKGGLHLCAKNQRENADTVCDRYYIPPIDYCIANMRSAEVVSSLNSIKRY